MTASPASKSRASTAGRARGPVRRGWGATFPHARGGLTLIELLVASVLAVLLMFTVVALLRSVAQQLRLAETSAGMQPASRRLADLLRRDFMNSAYIRIRPGYVQLAGPLAQSPATGLPTFRTAEVTYRIVRHHRRSLLVRDQRQAHGPASRTRSEVAWYGARQMQVLRFDEDEDDGAPPGHAHAPRGMDPMPEHIVVVVHGANRRPLLTAEVFHHREYAQ